MSSRGGRRETWRTRSFRPRILLGGRRESRRRRLYKKEDVRMWSLMYEARQGGETHHDGGWTLRGREEGGGKVEDASDSNERTRKKKLDARS